MRRLGLLSIALVACDEPKVEERPPPPVILPDAAVATAPVYSISIDGGAVATRERRTLHITLMSTPSGTTVKVDGKPVGQTPAYWEGEFTGRERVFTFELPGYTTAVYRFVPIEDGFVHGRLEKVADVQDAGL